MKQIMTICKFTFLDGLRKKAFIITTAVMLILVVGFCGVTALIGSGSGSDETAQEDTASQPSASEYSSKCYFADDTGKFADSIAALQSAFPTTEFIAATAQEADGYKESVADDGNISIIHIIEQDGKPFIQIITKDFMSGISTSDAADVLTKSYVSDILSDAGMDAATIGLIQEELPYSVETMGDMNLSGFAIGVLLTMLIFFAVYYYGYGVAMSIATEKTSRVMETLIVSAKPSSILMGKCLGMGLLGLLQFGGLIAVSAVSYITLVPGDFTIMGMPLSFSAFTPATAVLILLYFILGYILYAVMNSVCGATVSKIEDINSAMMPVVLISLASFYLGYMTSITASGSSSMLQKLAIYLPFSSPFAVPFKLLNGDIPASDLAISIGLMIVFIIVITAVSIRIYSASVLHYGKKLKLKDAYNSKI